MKKLLDKWYHRKVNIQIKNLIVAVVIMDIKKAYGKTLYLVSPVTGKGETWVESFIELNQPINQ